MPPTKEEELEEWLHIYQTRLGILCEDREPTEEQRAIAKQDADEAVRKMREREK